MTDSDTDTPSYEDPLAKHLAEWQKELADGFPAEDGGPYPVWTSEDFQVIKELKQALQEWQSLDAAMPLDNFPEFVARLQDAFPPRERGWSRHLGAAHVERVVSPARAGMVPSTTRSTPCAGGFPRASGDGPIKNVTRDDVLAFPPRERGWSVDGMLRALAEIVSPARAGMVPG